MSSYRFTQISFARYVADWIEEIIRVEGLRFDGADIEIRDPQRRRADVFVWKRRRLEPALLIEIWDPATSPWEEPLDLALSKAWRNNIPYFVVWNIRTFYCWDTFEKGEAIDKLWWPHTGVGEYVCDALTYDDAIERYAEAIKNYLRIFLKEFADVYFKVKAKPLLGLDERFIYRLRGTIYALAIPVFEDFKKRVKDDIEFRKGLINYFKEQGWTFKVTDEADVERVARQYMYLLINKLLFYNVLRPKFSLPKIVVPEVGLTGKELRERLSSYFVECFRKTGNYETVLLTDFLDLVPPPDDVVGKLKDFIHKLGEHDFSKLDYEVLGNIFQRLIPDEERHKLGQYFTRSDVVDLIIGFCIRDADAKVLDGGVGAGTFLVRAYTRKKLLNPVKTHRELLSELYGVDIAKFPATLATINLASKNLLEVRNYPNIIWKDFFDPDVKCGKEVPLAKLTHEAETLGLSKATTKLPEYFDAVVMNPPYTRQEEMEDILEEEKDKAYKTCIQDWINLRPDKYRRSKPPKLSKRSSIYVHFFIHGASFLREGGRLGLITSNSWLDVDYGGDLQRFFLENFKIIAIIESKVERWFEDADINTAITILECCSNENDRNENLVRFVQLKKPLSYFIPPTENEDERWSKVEKLIEVIEKTQSYIENEDLRIFPKKQKELWEEGYDEEKGEYVGAKWGKYLRAPDIFFRILNKGKGILISLEKCAKVEAGIKTGADSFFYLKDEDIKKWQIEEEFIKSIEGPNFVIKSIRECDCISVKPSQLKYKVLMIHEDLASLQTKNVIKYINYGVSLGLSNPKIHPTCGKRAKWYDLGDQDRPPIVWPDVIYERYIAPWNEARAYVDYDLHEIKPYKPDEAEVICAMLNSTLTPLFAELFGRTTLGQGALKMQRFEIAKLLIPNPNQLGKELKVKLDIAFKNLKERPIGTIFEEIGAQSSNEVSLNKICADRRELDKIIMGEILGLTEQEQLEIYKAVVDLVKSKIERARSIERGEKVGELDVDALVDSVLEDVRRLHGVEFKRFPEDYVEGYECRVIEVPKGSKVEAGVDLEGYYVQVDGEKLRCSSPYEARFIEYAVLAGKTRVSIPKDEEAVKRIVEEYGKLVKDAKKLVEDFINETITDRKLREKVRFKVRERLGF